MSMASERAIDWERVCGEARTTVESDATAGLRRELGVHLGDRCASCREASSQVS